MVEGSLEVVLLLNDGNGSIRQIVWSRLAIFNYYAYVSGLLMDYQTPFKTY